MKGFKLMLAVLLGIMAFSNTAASAEESTNTGREPFENLGPQVEFVNVIKGKAGKDRAGNSLYYALLQGEPAKLAVVNIDTNQIVDMKDLTGAKAAWAIEIAKDGMVMIGSTPNEHVYKYNPDEKILEDLGKATTPSDTVIWDMAYDSASDRLYGVTSYGGNVFYHNSAEGFVNLGKALDGAKYARSIVVDSANNVLYVGVGSPAALIKWDLKTGEKVNILPSEYENASSVYDLDLVNGNLFAKLEGQSVIVQFNTLEDRAVNVLEANSRGVSQPISENDPFVYYSNNSKLFKYNYLTMESHEIASDLNGTGIVSFDFVKKSSGQAQLVGITGNGGRFYTYNPATDKFSMNMLSLPAQSVEIYNIGSGPKGEIYSSGFISGHLGILKPSSNEKIQYQGLGQVEKMAAVDGKMFFGVYPSAKIYQYDPEQTWSKGSNPKELLNLGAYGQDRPVAMAANEDSNELYIGTFPKRGYKSGSLLFYDTDKNETVFQSEISPNQSVVALAYDKNSKYLYVGTSVYNGSSTKSSEGAQLFRMDPKDLSVPLEKIDISTNNALYISALTVSEDGKVWGIVDDKLMVYDPETDKSLLMPIRAVSVKGMSQVESLLVGKDGYIHGTLQGSYFRVDPETYEISVYRTSDVYKLAEDSSGRLYFNGGANLWRINPEYLTEEHAINPSDIQIPHVTVQNSPFPVARVSAKKPLTLYQSVRGAMVPVKTLKAGGFYRVFGTKGNYYHVGNEHYIYHEDSKMATYIGRVLTETGAPILAPDGSVFRVMEPGEEIKVYNYDEKGYDVGGGFRVLKSPDVTYYIARVTLTASSDLYEFSTNTPVMELGEYQELMILGFDGTKLDIGNGFYVEYDKNKMEYKKN